MAKLLDETGPFMILEDYLHDSDDEDLEASFNLVSLKFHIVGIPSFCNPW